MGARPTHDIVVVGASAGGVEALGTLVAGLPEDLSAAVFLVLHVLPGGTSMLAQILARNARLPVRTARDGEPIERGTVYVAPPDHHLLIEEDRVRLTKDQGEQGHRPAVDPLFRSAAAAFGPRVVGVVLTGALADGSAGLKAIAESGGAAIVQDPADARYPSMPRAALAAVPDARVVPIADMPEAVCQMTAETTT